MNTNETAAMGGEMTGVSSVTTEATQNTNAAVTAAQSGIGGDAAPEKKSGAQLLREAFKKAQTGEVAVAQGADGAEMREGVGGATEVGTETAGATVGASDAAAVDKKQTKEENATYAAARRRAEADYEKKLKDDRDKLNAAIGGLGIVDPATGKVVSDLDGLRAFQKKRAESHVSEAAKRAGMNEDELRALIDAHPDVAAAKEMRAQMEAEREKTVKAQMQAQLSAELSELAKINPSVSTFESLRSLDRYEAIRGYVNKGLSLVEGYKLAYMDVLSQRREAHSAAQARAEALTKSHLSPVGGVSGEGVEATATEIKEMRRWGRFGKMTDAEIAQVIKRTRGK